jgi:hypothetical protein
MNGDGRAAGFEGMTSKAIGQIGSEPLFTSAVESLQYLIGVSHNGDLFRCRFAGDDPNDSLVVV